MADSSAPEAHQSDNASPFAAWYIKKDDIARKIVKPGWDDNLN